MTKTIYNIDSPEAFLGLCRDYVNRKYKIGKKKKEFSYYDDTDALDIDFVSNTRLQGNSGYETVIFCKSYYGLESIEKIQGMMNEHLENLYQDEIICHRIIFLLSVNLSQNKRSLLQEFINDKQKQYEQMVVRIEFVECMQLLDAVDGIEQSDVSTDTLIDWKKVFEKTTSLNENDLYNSQNREHLYDYVYSLILDYNNISGLPKTRKNSSEQKSLETTLKSKARFINNLANECMSNFNEILEKDFSKRVHFDKEKQFILLLFFLYGNTNMQGQRLLFLRLAVIYKELGEIEAARKFKNFIKLFVISEKQIELLEDDAGFPHDRESNSLFISIINESNLSESLKSIARTEYILNIPLQNRLIEFGGAFVNKTEQSAIQIFNNSVEQEKKDGEVQNSSFLVNGVIFELVLIHSVKLEWQLILINYDQKHKKNNGNELWRLSLNIEVVEKEKRTEWNLILQYSDESGTRKPLYKLYKTIPTVNTIIEEVRIYMDTHDRFNGTTIVGIWHAPQYEGHIPERCLTFMDGVSISVNKEENVYTVKFNVEKESEQPAEFFYHENNRKWNGLNNISAIVGKNGTGKTTLFRMISWDSTINGSSVDFEPYVIFYRIRDQYYYSTNAKEGHVVVSGLDEQFNITNAQIKNSSVIFYSNAFTMNWNGTFLGMNGTELSAEAVFREYKDSFENRKKLHRYWDTMRKIQLINDFGSENLKKYFNFTPTICHIEFARQMKNGRFSAGAQQWMDEQDSKSDNTMYSGDIRLDVDSKENTSMILSLYSMIVRYVVKNTNITANANNLIDRVKIEIPGLSSGQYAMLNFLGRLHSFFKSQSGKDKEKDFNCFETGNSEIHNYILLLDEIELYMHPEWQRCFIDNLISFLEWENKEYNIIENIQIVLSSNSPFFMSDLPKENICMLYADEQEKHVGGETFVQNIHTILKNSFFMEHGLTGQFAHDKVNGFIHKLKQENAKIEPHEKREICYVKDHIGEPMVREYMQKLYNYRFPEEHKSKKDAVPVWTEEELRASLPVELVQKLLEQKKSL